MVIKVHLYVCTNVNEDLVKVVSAHTVLILVMVVEHARSMNFGCGQEEDIECVWCEHGGR